VGLPASMPACPLGLPLPLLPPFLLIFLFLLLPLPSCSTSCCLMRRELNVYYLCSLFLFPPCAGEEQDSLMALKKFEKKFGQSPVFVLSTFHEEGGGVASASPGSTLKEAIHVISCGYEDKTEWGKEVRKELPTRGVWLVNHTS